MQFDAAFIRTLGGLARLDIEDAAAERLAGELTRILAYVEQLGGVEAAEGQPEGRCERRSDVAVASNPEPVLSQSAGRKEGFVEIPPVKEES